MNTIKFNVFGRLVTVEKADSGWAVYYPGADGKRRPAQDIIIPAFVSETELENYLSDLCHEWATDNHPNVRRLDKI